VQGTNIVLGPGVNLARVPLCGRNFEYLSGEDPVLGSQLIPHVVRGIQSQNISACVKHFVFNNQVSVAPE
jgi:beta-glucosidase